MRKATGMLGEVPLSGRVIRAAHATLLEGVRGQGRAPGEYRRGQNMIGAPGCSEEEAKFLPIAPVYLAEGISRWETYLHSQQPDVLVQLAIAHAEFEALHPFWDGNGRLGRMLIPLYLFSRELLSAPTFYISAYLEAHRDQYYDRLLAVSRDGDWTGWCEFFLGALEAQAESNTGKARDILDLYSKKKEWVIDQTGSKHAIRALDFVFDRPVFPASDFVGRAGIAKTTAKRILGVLREGGMLRVLREPGGREPAIMAFPELLNIVEGKSVF